MRYSIKFASFRISKNPSVIIRAIYPGTSVQNFKAVVWTKIPEFRFKWTHPKHSFLFWQFSVKRFFAFLPCLDKEIRILRNIFFLLLIGSLLLVQKVELLKKNITVKKPLKITDFWVSLWNSFENVYFLRGLCAEHKNI